jgi:hypothetical protein
MTSEPEFLRLSQVAARTAQRRANAAALEQQQQQQ